MSEIAQKLMDDSVVRPKRRLRKIQDDDEMKDQEDSDDIIKSQSDNDEEYVMSEKNHGERKTKSIFKKRKLEDSDFEFDLKVEN